MSHGLHPKIKALVHHQFPPRSIIYVLPLVLDHHRYQEITLASSSHLAAVLEPLASSHVLYLIFDDSHDFLALFFLLLLFNR